MWYQCCFYVALTHVRLTVNSAADIAAKAALLLPVSKLIVPHADYGSFIHTQALIRAKS